MHVHVNLVKYEREQLSNGQPSKIFEEEELLKEATKRNVC
jgi:hypothetical protein